MNKQENPIEMLVSASSLLGKIPSTNLPLGRLYRSRISIDADSTENKNSVDKILGDTKEMMDTRVGFDLENVYLRGDTDLPTGENESAGNNFLGFQDGLIKTCLEHCEIKSFSEFGLDKIEGTLLCGPTFVDFLVEQISHQDDEEGDRTCETGKLDEKYNVLEVPFLPEDYEDGNTMYLVDTPLDNLAVNFYELESKVTYDEKCDRHILETLWYFCHGVKDFSKVTVYRCTYEDMMEALKNG